MATFATISLAGLWLERYLLVYPSLYTGAAQLPFSWYEPAMLLLFAGLYGAALAFFLTRVPLFQLWQPLSELELQGVSVEMSREVASTQ
jgi:hypothetical protein